MTQLNAKISTIHTQSRSCTNAYKVPKRNKHKFRHIQRSKLEYCHLSGQNWFKCKIRQTNDCENFVQQRVPLEMTIVGALSKVISGYISEVVHIVGSKQEERSASRNITNDGDGAQIKYVLQSNLRMNKVPNFCEPINEIFPNERRPTGSWREREQKQCSESLVVLNGDPMQRVTKYCKTLWINSIVKLQNNAKVLVRRQRIRRYEVRLSMKVKCHKVSCLYSLFLV
mmetsp:Transcript_1905/g.2541  ORF Transcript_1905/g.2541 Transcript_1905/m.2541 type:complete len:227 (-) Transcript_1905:1260-1940(-)